MSTGGWILLIISIGTVLCLFTFCLVKLLTDPKEAEHMHGLISDTPDVEEDNKTE